MAFSTISTLLEGSTAGEGLEVTTADVGTGAFADDVANWYGRLRATRVLRPLRSLPSLVRNQKKKSSAQDRTQQVGNTTHQNSLASPRLIRARSHRLLLLYFEPHALW